jgi:hypothetical protein
MSNIFESLGHAFSCTWDEYEFIDHWHCNHKVLERRRKCIYCGRVQKYYNWRYWLWLEPWKDIK